MSSRTVYCLIFCALIGHSHFALAKTQPNFIKRNIVATIVVPPHANTENEIGKLSKILFEKGIYVDQSSKIESVVEVHKEEKIIKIECFGCYFRNLPVDNPGAVSKNERVVANGL